MFRPLVIPCPCSGLNNLLIREFYILSIFFSEYLKKSQENKEKNDKERLENYYKRNYKDYFGALEGSLKQKKELTETEKGILEWLEKNK